MNRIYIYLTLTQIGLAITSPLFAIEEQIRIFRGIRSAGMGGVLVTTGNYGEALYGNPARHVRVDVSKVSFLDLTLEANANLLDSYSDLQNMAGASGSEVISKASNLLGQNQHGRIQNLSGYYNPSLYDELGGAFGFLFSGQTNVLIRPTTDIDTQTIVDTGFSVGLAHSYAQKRLSVGINLHLLYRMGLDKVISSLDFLSGRSLKPREYASQGIGIDADVGGYYQIPWEPRFMRLNVGASVNGLLQTGFNTMSGDFISGISPNPPRQDRVLNLGVRADFPDTETFKATLLALEIQNIGSLAKRYSLLKRVHLGGETRLSRRLSVRLGFYQGYPSAGIGVDLPVVKLDLATYGEELGGVAGEWQDRRYLFRIAAEI